MLSCQQLSRALLQSHCCVAALGIVQMRSGWSALRLAGWAGRDGPHPHVVWYRGRIMLMH